MAPNGHKIQRVFPLLLELEKNKSDYLPEAVSVGPYHHGDPKLAFVEVFIKPMAVDLFVLDGPGNMEFYYDRVVGIIGEIRDCYVRGSMRDFSDDDLALMMLRDAAFIISYMEIGAGTLCGRRQYMGYEMFKNLGNLTFVIVWRDLVLLDNQIPLFVVKLLMDSRYGEGHHHKQLDGFMKRSTFRAEKQIATPQESMRGEPLHLLEAFHRLVVKAVAPTQSYPTNNYYSWLCCSRAEKQNGVDDQEIGISATLCKRNRGSLIHRLLKSLCCRNKAMTQKNNDDDKYENLIHSFRTVKDLKANGIYFSPSPSQSLKDVRFRSHFFYARLELPEWFVSIYTKVFFKNLVAFEVSPKSPTQWEVASYINLMKSLIEGPEDVKELRERRILFNTLGSDQDALSVYNDIDTHGVDNPDVFRLVKDQIEAHYNSRVQRWMAELFHNNFRSPWTAIAFLGAFSVLAIAAAQLYYAVHPSPN